MTTDDAASAVTTNTATSDDRLSAHPAYSRAMCMAKATTDARAAGNGVTLTSAGIASATNASTSTTAEALLQLESGGHVTSAPLQLLHDSTNTSPPSLPGLRLPASTAKRRRLDAEAPRTSIDRQIVTSALTSPVVRHQESTMWLPSVLGTLDNDVGEDDQLPLHSNDNECAAGALHTNHGDQLREQDDAAADASSDAPSLLLSLLHHQQRIGCAYLDLEQQTLFVLVQDIEEDATLSALDMLLTQLEPSMVIASARSTEALVDRLRVVSREQAFKLSIMAAADYALSNLKLLPVAGFVDVDAVESDRVLSLRCAAGLLAFMSRTERGVNRRWTVESFGLEKLVHVSKDMLTGLQIFEDEAHPSTYGKNTKEGLSLFGLLNHTLTSAGKNTLRTWLLRPTSDLATLHARHTAIAYFMAGGRAAVADEIRDSLRHVRNVPRIMDRMKMGVKAGDFQAILKFTFHALKIRTLLESLPEQEPTSTTAARPPLLAALITALEAPLLQQAGTRINRIVDFDESLLEDRVVVKAEVNDELDELKRVYAGLDSFLSQVAREVQLDIPLDNDYGTMNVVYIPQIGFLVSFPLKRGDSGGSGSGSATSSSPGAYEIPGFEYQFCGHDLAYYKSAKMRELDETIGDIHGSIVDLEIEIIQELHESLTPLLPMFIKSNHFLTQLDCLLSLMVAARRNNYCMPVMVDEPKMDVVGGRHPLQEVTCATYIKNNIALPSTSTTAPITLLTGPNFSGKSIHLKQIAMIVYMAHVGSFVPADRAVVGVVDKIFGRIQTRESASRNESAFMIDLKQVLQALTLATNRSLVVLDEFGKGTLLADGIGLLCATINHWARRGTAGCPMLMVATHFHELFHNNLLDADVAPLISYQTMEVLWNADDSLTFLYRVRPGRAESSLGIHCAKEAGISRDILERATQLTKRFMTVDEKKDDNDADDATDSLSSSVDPVAARTAAMMESFMAMDMHGASALADVRRLLAGN